MDVNPKSATNYQEPQPKADRPLEEVTSSQRPATSNLHPSTLLPTETIVELAKYEGVDFGTGDPGERIRYFIKLGLLPNQVRRAPSSQLSVHSSQTKENTAAVNRQQSTFNPTGHLPFSAVEKLVKIDRLNKRGLTFPQIAQRFKHQEYQDKINKEITAALPAKKPKKALHYTKNILLFSPLACLLVLIAVTISLKAFPQASASFLQLSTINNQLSTSQVLGAKAYQNPVSNAAAAVLRPFTNLAQVILYGPN